MKNYDNKTGPSVFRNSLECASQVIDTQASMVAAQAAIED